MKRMATAMLAIVIFVSAWSAAQGQTDFSKSTHNDSIIAPELETKTKTIAQASADVASEPEKPKNVSTPKSKPKAAQTAPKKAVTDSTTCGPQSPSTVYAILREIGVPKTSAIQLLGSWKTESGFDYCQQRGDGGKAWGLNSWHPARRYDMPMSSLRAQINWAVHTEMKRDCASCYATLMAGGDKWSVRSAIQQSTRWGVEGGRWLYADQFEQQF